MKSEIKPLSEKIVEGNLKYASDLIYVKDLKTAIKKLKEDIEKNCRFKVEGEDRWYNDWDINEEINKLIRRI